jgi:hypothetical protein
MKKNKEQQTRATNQSPQIKAISDFSKEVDRVTRIFDRAQENAMRRRNKLNA